MSQTATPATFQIEREESRWILRGQGNWDLTSIQSLDADIRAVESGAFPGLVIDTSAVDNFDTAGAWLVERLRRASHAAGKAFQHIDDDDRRIELARVVQVDDDGLASSNPARSSNLIADLGRVVVQFGTDFVTACNLIGASIQSPQMKAGKKGAWRWNSILTHFDRMGLRAVPVIFVMSFLIGGIIAQQGAFQLKAFGEELLTVNLVAILLLREIGVLLTAVMVAGRSGSAITAELGTMKMREEIDALHVIGLNPVGVLIFPRLVALIIALPILTLIANFAGLFGAMVVSYLYIDIPPNLFFNALLTAIDLNTLAVGLIKAPFMAIIIGLVASVEGMKVGGSSESLGQRTTSAVVRSIFAVILVDGLFAIFYGAIGY